MLVILGAGLGNQAASAPAPGQAYLPDLRTLDPSEFHISKPEPGTKLLLLSNTVWNGGDGPLEMRPEHDQGAGVTHAFQLLFTEDQDGRLVQLPQEHAAGTFAFHPAHDHWHFQDLARYVLVTMNADGSEGKTVASSEKISFCMFDQIQIDETLEHAAPEPDYSGAACSQNTNVGYSVSWGDEYAYNFADQDIDVTGISPGRYFVVSTADPEGLIQETDDDNNSARTAIKLRRDDVLTITGTAGRICAPCGLSTLDRGTHYTFRGHVDPPPGPAPAYPTPKIELSFKPRGPGTWTRFGSPESDKAFRLTRSSEGYIAVDGHWNRDFRAYKGGTWIVRARYPGSDDFTTSSVKLGVEVD
jgi:hypothetical protein